VTPLKKERTFLLTWVLPYAFVSAVLGWQFRGELSGEKPDLLMEVIVGTAMFVILFFAVRRKCSRGQFAEKDWCLAYASSGATNCCTRAAPTHRGLPAAIPGSERCGRDLGVRLRVRRLCQWPNGTKESFNGKFRDECLSMGWPA
jgi:hypothetical protein